MPYLDELRERLRLVAFDIIDEIWYKDLVTYLETTEKYGAVDYIGYVHASLIPDKDALYNLGLFNLRFKEVHSVYGYFYYTKSDIIIFNNISGDYGNVDKLHFSKILPVKIITSDYVASYGEIIFADASAGVITVTLPAPVRGAWVVIKKIDTTANDVYIDGAGALIDGNTTLRIRWRYECYFLISDGSNWYIIAYYS